MSEGSGIGFLFVLAFVLIIAGFMLDPFSAGEIIGTEDVPCYDKYNNLIQDAVCAEDVRLEPDQISGVGIGMLFTGILLMVSSPIWARI